jgi:hypothetical protein
MKWYFPFGAVSLSSRYRYSSVLENAREEPLQPGEVSETYRFTWIGSFHPEIIIRAESQDRGVELLVKDRGHPSRAARWRRVQIKQRQWKSLLSALEKAHFWELAAEEEACVSDGADWVLEGLKDGRYHVVIRCSPYPGTFHRACCRLAKLSEVDVRRLY